jgi:NTP pyrophosphatase (non-canonical NTP hydrolase)
MHLAELQDLMERTYGAQDRERGIQAAVAWLAEEVGELARALRKGTATEQRDELADVLAWVATLANIAGIDLEAAVDRYRAGCPKCGAIPCRCGRLSP